MSSSLNFLRDENPQNLAKVQLLTLFYVFARIQFIVVGGDFGKEPELKNLFPLKLKQIFTLRVCPMHLDVKLQQNEILKVDWKERKEGRRRNRFGTLAKVISRRSLVKE